MTNFTISSAAASGMQPRWNQLFSLKPTSSRGRRECLVDHRRYRIAQERMSRDIVLIDNLGSHRNVTVRKAIRKADGTVIFLQNYSPDINPIEQVFSKLKHHLRTFGWLRRY
jgi:transposase